MSGVPPTSAARAVVVLGEGLPDIGGSGANQTELAVLLAAKGYAVAFASRWPVEHQGARLSRLREAGVDLLIPRPVFSKAVHRLARVSAPMDRPKSYRRRAQVLDRVLTSSIRDWARGRGQVVIHILGRETTQCLPSVKSLGFPIVFSEGGQLLNLGMTEADIRANPLAVNAYTADSSKAAALLSEVEGVEASFVPSLGGFGHEPVPGREQAQHFGTMSRLVPVKRLEVAVAAFQDFTQGRLTISGDGPEFDVLSRAIHDLGVADRVRLGGPVSPVDVARVIDDLDVLLLTSDDSEGTPVAVLEAMSRARPIIATRVGGLPDILDDGVSGFFFDGSPSGLAEKLREVSQPGVARQLGQAARAAWVDRFSPDHVMGQFVAIYESLERP